MDNLINNFAERALSENDRENLRLYNRVKARVEQGISQQDRLLEKVAAMVIRDKLVAPTAMRFFSLGDQLRMSYGTKNVGPEGSLTIHKHAITQLAGKVNLPITYVNYLQSKTEPWKMEMLAHILDGSYANTKFPDRAGNPKFLHRIVGNELRGFLSRRFNRHIASAPLLRSFIESCTQVGAVPFDATVSDIKVALKCLLPHVFEPVKGEYLCVGVEWSNSDFGAGRMQVALSMWMPQGDRFTVLDHVISRVHIGSVIEETDVDISDETARKEAEAQASAIRDSVVGQLSSESVDRLLNAVEMAHTENIPWHSLKGQLSRFLGKKDVETLQSLLEDDVLDLPAVHSVEGVKTPTKWWAAQALSWLANRTEDAEKKLELQHAAGSFLEVK
jgi:hypothetical protein